MNKRDEVIAGIEQGMTHRRHDYPTDYIAVAQADYDHETGARVYGLQAYRDELPAHYGKDFQTVDELLDAMIEIAPLDEWTLIEYEEG